MTCDSGLWTAQVTTTPGGARIRGKTRRPHSWTVNRSTHNLSSSSPSLHAPSRAPSSGSPRRGGRPSRVAPRLLVDKLAEAPPRSRLEGAALDADVRRRPARDALVRVADQIPASEERGQYDATCVSERERAARGEAMRERVSGRREARRCKREGDATTFVSERRRRERAAQCGGVITALLVTTRVAGCRMVWWCEWRSSSNRVASSSS